VAEIMINVKSVVSIQFKTIKSEEKVQIPTNFYHRNAKSDSH
jgi:hypothetical protein